MTPQSDTNIHPLITSPHTSLSTQDDSISINQPKLGARTVESIAGLSAGFITTLISHPLDYFKLRLQLDTQSKSQIQSFKNIWLDLVTRSKINVAPHSIDYNGLIKNLYRGVGPNLLGSTTAWGLYFTFYREYKNLLFQSFIQSDPTNSSHKDENLNSGHYLMCAFAAGWSTSILTNPIWVIKTRMISTSRTSAGAYSSIVDGIKQIYSKEGFRGYYKGLSPALLNVSQGALQFSIYDTLKNHIIHRNETYSHRDEIQLTTFQYLYASAASKMVSTVVFYPLQVVRSRLQVTSYNPTNQNVHHHQRQPQHYSMLSVCKSIVQFEGLKGFYKGVLANLIRVLPATCITFTVYENAKVILSGV